MLVIVAANITAMVTPFTIYLFFRPFAVAANDDSQFWDSMNCADPMEFMFFRAAKPEGVSEGQI